MGFRQKILLSFFIIFLIFALFMYPVMVKLIGMIQEKNLHTRTIELIQNLEAAPDFSSLIGQLKKREKFLFFRVTLLDANGSYIYDTHQQAQEIQTSSNANEVNQALEEGEGYDVRYSPKFGQEMAYMAARFTFQGKNYVLRMAFPYGWMRSLSHELSLTFLLLGIGMLFLFSLLAWFIFHILTRPVQQIIEAIKPYQLGKVNRIPEIKLKGIRPGDEFGNLAVTLNSLSSHIDHQISSLTHEKNEKSAILESLVEGVIAVDQTMKVIYMNRMVEVFLGISDKELVGKSFSVAHQPQCEELIKEAQRKGQPVVLVIKPERKQKRYLDAVAVPRGIGGAILVLQDKTSLHKVLELGKDFIANASHELKTPITIIRGFAETLHDHPELSREVHGEITHKIVTNCQRMDTLVKNLLILAAVDEGLPRSRLREYDLVELVKQAKTTLSSIHPDAKIKIKAVGDQPFILLIDSDLFFQAILNLLDNAVKYSKPPADVLVHIEKHPNEFIIRVSDKGIGIPQEDIDRIFERFYAVDKSHSRSLGGSGLGLSIVERIVDKHQGKIEVESEVGRGTTFTITLPVQVLG